MYVWDNIKFWGMIMSPLYTLCWILSRKLQSIPTPFAFGDWVIGWGDMFLLAVVIYSFASMRRIPGDRIGTKEFLGFPVQHVNPGLTFVPLWLAEVYTDTRNQIQLIIGTPDKDLEGKPIVVPPVVNKEGILVMRDTADMRITYADRGTMSSENRETFKDDPLGDRATTDPVVSAPFRIKHHPTFRTVIGSVEAAMVQIRLATSGALQRIAGQHTLAVAISQQKLLEEAITKAIEDRIGEPGKSSKKRRYWGVDFTEAEMVSYGISRTVNKAIAERNAAGFELETAKKKATAKRFEIAQTAEGEAQALETLGKTLGNDDGKRAREYTVVKAVADNSNIRVIGNGGNIMTTVAGVFEIERPETPPT